MQDSEASLHHDATVPLIQPQQGLPIALQLGLIPPIAPIERVGNPRPFFASCRDTQCGSLATKAVFLAYASVARPNGATWKVNGKRVHFYARQDRIATIAECDRRTVYRETQRLRSAGRLVRVKAGKGRLPHVYVVVPEGWASQTRGDTRSHLAAVDGTHDPINRAVQEPARSAQAGSNIGTIRRSKSVTKPGQRSKLGPAVPFTLLANAETARPHVEAMRAIAAKHKPRRQAENRAGPSLQPSLDNGGVCLEGYTGGTPETCPKCGYDRIYYGACPNCGADLRDYGSDWNFGH